jgi:retron-type reverse transcriptase
MLKNNYRPVSILTTFTKVHESIMADQLQTHFEPIFNKMLCAYRKKYGCDHVIVKLVDSWKWALDENKIAGTVLMDVSAFDCIPHGLLVSKLRAYGVSEDACKLLCSYLTGRLQRVKISDSTSSWRNITKGVPQGSRFGPDLFNIFMNDIFWAIMLCDLANYADDNTLSKTAHTVDALISALVLDTKNCMEWFKQNFMQANLQKFQAMIMKPTTVNAIIPDYIEVNDIRI